MVRVQNWLKHSIVDVVELVSLMFLLTKYRHIGFPNVMLSAGKACFVVLVDCILLDQSYTVVRCFQHVMLSAGKPVSQVRTPDLKCVYDCEIAALFALMFLLTNNRHNWLPICHVERSEAQSKHPRERTPCSRAISIAT